MSARLPRIALALVVVPILAMAVLLVPPARVSPAQGPTGPTAASPAAAPFVIAAAGDIACDPNSGQYNGGEGTATWCRMKDTAAVVRRIAPDLVLALGDTQYDEGRMRSFERVYDPTWGAFLPVTAPVIGNHEYWGGPPDGYFDYFDAAAGRRYRGWYSLDRGGWHLIGLNSNCDVIGCAPGSRQYEWLKADLGASSAACQLAFLHHPRFSSGPHGNTHMILPLWKLLFRAGVDLALVAHDHIYERFRPLAPDGARDPRGIRQITVGTGGVQHYWIERLRRNSVVHNANTFGVLRVDLVPGSYAWRFRPAVGRFRDLGNGACHGPPVFD